jgi:peptidyl-prolyl cis-trans isomerase C
MSFQRYFIPIFWILSLALGLSACGSFSPPVPEATPTPSPTFTPEPPTATPEPLALTVNAEGITVDEFEAEVQRYLAAQASLGTTVSPEEASRAVQDDLTAQLLLAQAARAGGFRVTEADLEARIASLVAQVGGTEALAAWQSDHGYTEDEFRSALKRSAEAAWMRDKILADMPSTAEQVHVQQILLYNQDTAQNFLNQLNGGADFDELALRADPLTRGDLGWIPRGYLLEPVIEEAAFALNVGAYSDVIPTDVGFHIVRILARDPQRTLSPDARLSLQELALRQWLEAQSAQANIIFAQQP